MSLEVSRPNDVPAALNALKGMVDALLMLPDTTVVTAETVESFLLFSQNNNIPVISLRRKIRGDGRPALTRHRRFRSGETGGGNGPARSSNGTAVSDLPGAEARKTHLKTNRSVAKKLGVSLDAIEQINMTSDR